MTSGKKHKRRIRRRMQRTGESYTAARNAVLTADFLSPTEPPRWRHDCKACRFLGRFDYDGPLLDGTTARLQADLYICRGDALGPTLLGRHSDEGSDYVSCPLVLVERDVAHMRAEPATHTPAILEALDRWNLRRREP